MRARLSGSGLAVAAVAGALCGWPAVSAGAVLRSERALPPEGQPILLLSVEPVGGETNTMSVSVAGGAVVVRDSTAPLRAGDAGCVLVSSQEARCAWGGQVSVRGSLGDRDDSLLLTGVPGTISGGEGSDRLRLLGPPGTLDGGPGNDVLEGGPGFDQLAGGDGSDILRGGDGDDQLRPEGTAPDDDLVDGGAGRDTVTYDRARRRRIDLRGRFPAAGAERESAQAVEVVFVSDGDDVIVGSALRERIFAGAGSDVVLAGGGNDYVNTGVGHDRVSAGRGNDVVDPGTHLPYLPNGATTPPPDDIGCGSGRDRVARVTAMDTLARDCEYLSDRVLDENLRPRAHPARVRARPIRIDRQTATFRLPCNRASDSACVGALTIRSRRGRRLGRRAFRISRGQAKDVRVRLSAAGLRMLRRRHGATVEVQAAYRKGGALEELEDVSWSTNLRTRR